MQGTHLVETPTPDILDCDSVRYFWIAWGVNAGQTGVWVGRGEIINQDVFLSYTNPQVYDISTVALSTGWGSTGEWTWDIEQGTATRHNLFHPSHDNEWKENAR